MIHGDFILGLPGETRESIRNTIDFAKQLDCETIQVSIAHAFPGTEFFDYAKENGFITNEAMSDDGGHQMAHIEYPGLPVEYVMEMVHKFYDEYYFRPEGGVARGVAGDRESGCSAALRRGEVLHEASLAAEQGGSRGEGSERGEGAGIRQHERVDSDLLKRSAYFLC